MMTTIRPGLILIKYAESVNIVPRALSEDDWDWPGEPGLAPGAEKREQPSHGHGEPRHRIDEDTVSMSVSFNTDFLD